MPTVAMGFSPVSTKSIFGLCTLCVLVSTISARSASNTNLQKLSEPCIAIVKEIMANKELAELQCSTPSEMIYTVPHVDTTWIRNKGTLGELFSGETLLDIPPGTLIDKRTQTLMLDAPPKLVNVDKETRSRRHLSVTMGVKTVLVVRVSATDSTTTSSEAELASDIFGDNGDLVNLKSRYSECSFGKLEMQKAADADGVSTNIRNGVVTIAPGVATSVGDQAMVNIINTKIAEEFSVAASVLADHVMYCLPPGTFGGLAYAYLNGFRSVYNDVWCSSISVQVHEVGHNLNMGHSSHEGDEYGDRSGMMGYSYSNDEAPLMCFNAAKSWQLGWYSDKAMTLTPLAAGITEYFGQLASIADYASASTEVLIEIEQTTSALAYYMNYNAAKGINSQTQEGADQVLVTRKLVSNESNLSVLVGALSPGESMAVSDFNGIIGETLTISFDSVGSNDIANVSIVLSGPAVPAPSISPTIGSSSQPTMSKSPSIHPSSTPSMDQSVPPSFSPSTVPSNSQSAAPSSRPSVSPSLSVSRAPSAAPSQEPTRSMAPSVSPSKIPSNVPTTIPSTEPSQSKGPSLSPSSRPSSTMVPSGSVSLFPSRSFVPTVILSSMPSIEPPSEGPSISMTPSSRPSNRPSISIEPSGEPSRSMIPSSLPTTEPSNMPSSLPSFLPSTVPTASVAPSSIEPSMLPSLQPSTTPSSSVSTAPSFVPSVLPSKQPTTSPSCLPSTISSTLPSSIPSYGSTAPSKKPSSIPSIAPSPTVSSSPSRSPSKVPSSLPSSSPSLNPTTNPSVGPSSVPSIIPSDEPSLSVSPSNTPTNMPSLSPSDEPSSGPSLLPSYLPSIEPSLSVSPSGRPSKLPSLSPSDEPSFVPSLLPSNQPSIKPSQSISPSYAPTNASSLSPSVGPRNQSFPPSHESSDEPSLSTIPSQSPSPKSSALPSIQPTKIPSYFPTSGPTKKPSTSPSGLLSASPSSHPSEMPALVSPGNPDSEHSTMPSPFWTDSPSTRPSTVLPWQMLPSGDSTTVPTIRDSWQILSSDDPTTVPTSRESSGIPSLALESFGSSSPSVEPNIFRRPTSAPLIKSSRKSGASSISVKLVHRSENSSRTPTTENLVPSLIPSMTTLEPSSSPSLEKSIEPTSKGAEMSLANSWPSQSDAVIEARLPSVPPSYLSLELHASVKIEVSSEEHLSQKVDLVCNATGLYFNQVVKAHYGNETETSLSCQTNSHGTTRKLTSILFIGTAKTHFYTTAAPQQAEYELFIYGLLKLDLTKATLLLKIVDAAGALDDPIHDIEMKMDAGATPPFLSFYFGQPLLPAVSSEDPDSLESSHSYANALSGCLVTLSVVLAGFIYT